MNAVNLARRRNGRPDTPDELYADAIARGEDPNTVAGAGNSIFNRPQVYDGNNFGTQDWSRYFTWQANNAANQFGGLLNQGQDLYGQGQNLYNQFSQLGSDARLNEQAANVARFNTDVLSGRMPQAIAQIASPYIGRAAGTINAQADTAKRQALDQLPRGGLAAEAVMGANDSAIKGIAHVSGNLYNTLANAAMANALGGGNPAVEAAILGQQAGVFGQQGNFLGQLGNIIGQQNLVPGNLVSNLGSLLNQRYGIQQAGQAAGK